VHVAVLICAYLPSIRAWSASSRGAHVGARRPLVARLHCPTLCDESTDESTENPPDKLVNLVLQCAIQAQLSYYAEFKNEIRTRWLEAFLGHEHLGVQRVSDRGSGVIKYRGLSGGMRCSWRDYLLTMLRAKQESYSCRYKVGTADMTGLPRPSADAPSASADAPWAAASASRAANPYLQKEEVQYREFTEVIAPSRIATELMSISAQLAEEWSTDLEYVATEGAYLLEQCEDLECVVPTKDSAPALLYNKSTSAAARDPLIVLPAELSSSARAAAMGWTNDLVDAPSPFRDTNFDLLERVCTREAAIATLAALEAEPSRHASAEWLRERINEWLPWFEEPTRTRLGGLLLLELIQSAPAARTDGETLGLTDPAFVAREVISQRERIARLWSRELKHVPAMNAALQREILEEQLEESLASDQEDS